MSFNEHLLDGWKCPCGEAYFDPDQAQRILLLNRLKSQTIKAKLGKIRSNLILRLPKEIGTALGFRNGEEVCLTVKGNELKVAKA
jgi:hypothetical protein